MPTTGQVQAASAVAEEVSQKARSTFIPDSNKNATGDIMQPHLRCYDLHMSTYPDDGKCKLSLPDLSNPLQMMMTPESVRMLPEFQRSIREQRDELDVRLTNPEQCVKYFQCINNKK